VQEVGQSRTKLGDRGHLMGVFWDHKDPNLHPTQGEIPMPKTPKGAVAIRTVRDRLWLRWHYQKRYELAIGLPDTATNRKVAERKAKQIELDIASGHFDETLAKYKARTQGSNALSVGDLFNSFIKYKSNYVLDQSLDKYKSLLNQLTQFFKTRSVKAVGEGEAVAFRDWLGKKIKPSTLKERIGLINSCWQWAEKQKLVENNPWTSAIASVKVPPSQRPKPFTREEIGLILQGFRTSYYYAFYLDFVEFKLCTGCRTGEAIALCWRHLTDDCSEVWFGESMARGKGRKATKTNRARSVRLTPRLKKLLLDRRPLNFNPDALVFPSPRGSVIDHRNFSQRAWKTVLSDAGVPYRRPYHTRHTLVSHAIELGMSVADVSQITGHLPETLMRHYLGGVNGKPELPDLF
jgi:integrase